ncbi:hypothetical protein HID58_005325 [Brassica napus]|uniref:Uncharacterized protein n=1 Tax=Brassica napus TaxID=3708 RepID=A0ABQ8E887_BRANA|nr:hypothetical protein HID58_005325 [Brassica napus]
MPPTIRRTNNKKESPPPKKTIEPAKKNKRLWRNHNPKSLRRNLGASPTPADPTQAASPTHSDSESTQSEEAAGSQVPPTANTQDPPVTPLSSRWLEEQSNHTGFTSNWSSTRSPISSPQGENDGENDPEHLEKVDTNKKATKEGENELEVMAANAEKVKKEAAEEVNEDVEDSPEDGEALTRPKRLAKPN